MAVPDWPTLSREPKSVRLAKADNTIRTDLADGKILSMSRTTTQRKQFEVAYHGMTDADYATVDAFEDARKIGAEVFKWVHPTRATTHYVILASPIAYTLDEESLTWRIECVFMEPGGTYT